MWSIRALLPSAEAPGTMDPADHLAVLALVVAVGSLSTFTSLPDRCDVASDLTGSFGDRPRARVLRAGPSESGPSADGPDGNHDVAAQVLGGLTSPDRTTTGNTWAPSQHRLRVRCLSLMERRPPEPIT